jgi:hypothetical protein
MHIKLSDRELALIEGGTENIDDYLNNPYIYGTPPGAGYYIPFNGGNPFGFPGGLPVFNY